MSALRQDIFAFAQINRQITQFGAKKFPQCYVMCMFMFLLHLGNYQSFLTAFEGSTNDVTEI